MGNVSVVEILLENGAIMDARDEVEKISLLHSGSDFIILYPSIPYIDWADSV